MSVQMPFTESGITVSFPDANYFRFCDCDGYRDLSGYNFKEMDICWHDSSNDTFYMIEFKDYTSSTTVGGRADHTAVDMSRKGSHSLAMIMSVLLGTTYSSKITACIPTVISKTTKIKLIYIVNVPSHLESYLPSLGDNVKHNLRPFKELYGIDSCVLMSYSQAKKIFTWVS